MKEFLTGILDQSYWASTLQALSSWAIKTIPSVILIVVLALGAVLLFKFGIRRLTKILLKKSERGSSPMEARRQVETLTGILRKAGKTVIWAIALMMLLREIGIEIGPVLAGAGIAGLAIGFGAQSIVRDIISGFFLLIEGQVRVGDVAVINGKSGLVEAINLRTIVLRDLEGVVHIFPHGLVDTVSNMTKEWSAAILDIGVAYKEDTDKVVDVMRQVAEGLKSDPALGPMILEPMEVFGVDDFQDSAVVIKARIKTKPLQQWAVSREYRRSKREARESYDRLSRWYDLLAGRSERRHREEGLKMLGARNGETILEIGFGTGHSLVSLARSAGSAGSIFGVDVFRGMREVAWSRVQEAGVSQRVRLLYADGAKLPFKEKFFDAVFMSFTLELFDPLEIPLVLGECLRVLRTGGRICTVTMAETKSRGAMLRLYMWFHEKYPALADCRPILAVEAMKEAGFQMRDAASASMWGLPVEIVLAAKNPDAG